MAMKQMEDSNHPLQKSHQRKVQICTHTRREKREALPFRSKPE